jgi:predicted Zn-dependent protease
LLALHPDRADVLITLARAVARDDRSRTSEAIGHIETAFALESLSLTDVRAVAELVRRRASPQTAERLMRRAIERHPASIQAYAPLIDVLLDQDRPEEAEELMRRTLALFPFHGEAYAPLADFLLGQGRADEAKEILHRAAALRRPPPELLVRLAQMLADTGDAEGAGAVLHKALALEPSNPAAMALVERITQAPATSPPVAPAPAKSGFRWSGLLKLGRPG